MSDMTLPHSAAETPCGLNHIVLNVRDMEESHRFWAGLLGFRHVGTSRRPDPGGKPPDALLQRRAGRQTASP